MDINKVYGSSFIPQDDGEDKTKDAATEFTRQARMHDRETIEWIKDFIGDVEDLKEEALNDALLAGGKAVPTDEDKAYMARRLYDVSIYTEILNLINR